MENYLWKKLFNCRLYATENSQNEMSYAFKVNSSVSEGRLPPGKDRDKESKF